MMKLLSFAALSYVAAADVPVFSSNDDYDEINLNIRLLQNNATVNVTTYVMTGDLTTKYTTAENTAGLCAAVKVSTQKTLVTTLKSSSATIDTCDEVVRRGRALQAGESSIKQGYSAVFASEAGATAAKATVESGSFAADFAAALTTQMATDGVTAASAPTVTSASASAPVTQVNGQTVTAAPTPAPTPVAAPSPAASSDASMLKANVALAAVAAVFASMF
jgi:hypothetical protein